MFSRKFGIVSILSVLCLVVSATAASVSTSWHGRSQQSRNLEILDVALDQLGDNTGVECKEWVQDVVYESSNGVVYPPQNSNDYTWASSSNVRKMVKPFPIEWVEKGQIIQMRWRNQTGDRETYPHTAILKSKTSTKMVWVDCNWHGDETVITHTIYYSDFYACVGNNYNVYEIK